MTDDKAVPPEKIHFHNIDIIEETRRHSHTHNEAHQKDIIEYILKPLHLKIKNDWFARGLKAGKISKNSSGCCCVIEDDGETISSLCGAHKALYDKKEEETSRDVAEYIEELEEQIAHLNLELGHFGKGGE